MSAAMQIQDDSAYVLDENPAALLDGAEIEATAHYRCLKIVRLWKQSSSLPRSRRDEMVEEEQRLANLYAATLFEIGCAFGIETADDLNRLRAAGFHAFLIGESLMRQQDPGKALENLLAAAAERSPLTAGHR